MAPRKTPGLLGKLANASGGTVDFRYVPRKGHKSTVVFTRPTENGTVQLGVRSNKRTRD